jgi:DNA-binding MarR family transcriptional regulator
MDRTTLLRAMKPLQREALVRSGSSEGDPRQLVYFLTPSGERRLKQALPLWTRAQEEFEAEIGSREAAQLRRSLLGLARES